MSSVRGAVLVTWSVRRKAGGAPWPEWQTVPGQAAGGMVGGMHMEVAPAAAQRLAGAVGGVVESAGSVFGCGLALDDAEHDGGVREAAVEVVSLGVLTYPGPWCGDEATASAVVEIQSEAAFGPNSFRFGRMLAERLGPFDWRYTEDAVAVCDVAKIEVDGPVGGPGRMVIYPARTDIV